MLACLAYNTATESVLQDGPQCGLVALHMACNVIDPHNNTSVANIQEYAKQMGFTKQGEIFSAEWMSQLASKVLSVQSTVLPFDKNTILQSLVHKTSILVPYDADFNHEPCCKKGHKAHWALVTGFVILKNEDTTDRTQDSSIQLHRPHSLDSCSLHKCNVLGDPEEKHLFLFARQGKSKHLHLWDYESLCASNNNLHEIGPSRDADSYLLPPEGVQQSMSGKIVVVNGAKTSNV